VSFTPPKSYFLSLPKAKQIRRRQFKKKNKSYEKPAKNVSLVSMMPANWEKTKNSNNPVFYEKISKFQKI
jgi:hypothetical protein